MTVRKATDLETQNILNHALAVLKEATMGHVVPSRKKAMQMVSPFLLDGGYYLVYAKNKMVKGWIGVGRTRDVLTGDIVGMIPELYVMPAHRKQGIAKELCEEALRQLKQEGYKKVQLNVFKGNHAKHLYRKLGFQEITVLMERDLDSNI